MLCQDSGGGGPLIIPYICCSILRRILDFLPGQNLVSGPDFRPESGTTSRNSHFSPGRWNNIEFSGGGLGTTEFRAHNALASESRSWTFSYVQTRKKYTISRRFHPFDATLSPLRAHPCNVNADRLQKRPPSTDSKLLPHAGLTSASHNREPLAQPGGGCPDWNNMSKISGFLPGLWNHLSAPFAPFSPGLERPHRPKNPIFARTPEQHI